MTGDLLSRVRTRARHRCEYCQVPQSAFDFPFHLEHVIARQHGGKTTLGNTAFSCPHCNFHKGPNISSYAIVKRKRRLVPLYNPRRHRWGKHFRWDGPRLVGLTAIGRATIHVLAMNAPEEVAMRQRLIGEGIFPPQATEV
jgi:hypothetical protein